MPANTGTSKILAENRTFTLCSMNEDEYEELVQVWVYSCLKKDGKYVQVHRVGVICDKGRDVYSDY